MIDNNNKSSLHNGWNMRIIVIYFSNGLKRIFRKNSGRIISLLYLTACLIFWKYRYLIWKPEGLFLNLKMFIISALILVIISSVTFVTIFLIGMPFGASSISNNLHRIGFVNSVGEAPLLLSKSIDKNNSKIITLEFKTFGIPLSEWADNQDRIESALNIHIDEIYEGKNCRSVIVKCVDGENRLSDYIEWSENLLSDENFEIVLGEGYSGRVSVNISKIPHMLIGGSTGSGKSVLLKLVLMQCVKKGAKIYIADFKGGVDFPPIWHTKCSLLTDEKTLHKVLVSITDELQSRKQILRTAGVANIDEYNRNAKKKLYRIVFACDEIAEVLDKTGLSKQQKDEILKIESELSIIARQGRAFGIHLVLATQRPDAAILNGQIRNNIDTRICGRADNVLSQIILDNTDASDKIAKSSQGRFLINSGKIFQAYWFDENIL
ncbi:FtsK/SpoIIIE domain-containing protein [Ruminococcus bromii]|uniref:FtsK/SpoIIIE domain-containing protein n=1 Tax=Ruminococcus bromii TaxID=40518 RepID=UPI0039F588EC